MKLATKRNCENKKVEKSQKFVAKLIKKSCRVIVT